METRANHIWVGAVTLALLAATAFGIVWLARISQGSQNEYDIFFKQSVAGLAKGSQVAFAGVPAGQVRTIQIWDKDPDFVRVRIAVDEEVPMLVGTTATISASFTGVSTINLDGARRGAPPISCSNSECPEGNVPAIPTKTGGFGEILANAPLLLERLATLTERLTALLSDRNQSSIAGILDNTDAITRNVAQATPQIQNTMVELQGTLREAQGALAAFQQITRSTDDVINREGNQLADQLRTTLRGADGVSRQLEQTLASTRPTIEQLNQSTLPAAEATLRDLRATSKALRQVTEKINQQGATSILSGPKLPDYEPE